MAYDDGVKEPWTVKEGKQASSLPEGVRLRRQLVAMVFNKSTSRRVPMTMRMLMTSAASWFRRLWVEQDAEITCSAMCCYRGPLEGLSFLIQLKVCHFVVLCFNEATFKHSFQVGLPMR